MDINELRNIWNLLLSAGIENKYEHSKNSNENLLEKIKEFDVIWKQYKEDIIKSNESRDRK